MSYESTLHAKPQKILLHIPPVGGLENVLINGKRFSVKPGGLLRL